MATADPGTQEHIFNFLVNSSDIVNGAMILISEINESGKNANSSICVYSNTYKWVIRSTSNYTPTINSEDIGDLTNLIITTRAFNDDTCKATFLPPPPV